MIALTDGEDNESTSTPEDVVKKIIDNQIILDSFIVSDATDVLKCIAFASGG
jgi:hypothetical protein